MITYVFVPIFYYLTLNMFNEKEFDFAGKQHSSLAARQDQIYIRDFKPIKQT